MRREPDRSAICLYPLSATAREDGEEDDEEELIPIFISAFSIHKMK